MLPSCAPLIDSSPKAFLVTADCANHHQRKRSFFRNDFLKKDTVAHGPTAAASFFFFFFFSQGWLSGWLSCFP